METRNAASIAILVFLAAYARTQEAFGKCVTPNSLMGECKVITSCEYVMSMIKSRLSMETINDIRKYQCGFQGSQPLVCCPEEVPQRPSGPNLRLLPRRTCGLYIPNAIFTQRASLFEYPWMVLLRYKDGMGVKNRCGGVIINERYILTAAHCITKLPKGLELESVRLGESVLDSDPDCDGDTCAPPVEDYGIEELLPHPQFDNIKIQHDIALIRLDRTINFNRESTQPVCLPLEDVQYPRSIIVGWGVTMQGEASTDMIWNEAKAVDIAACAEQYRKFTTIHNSTQTCVQPDYLSDGRCVANSGGPLLGLKDGRAVVRGVMSFAAQVCKSGTFPGVYNLVEPYVDWILSSMKE